MSGARVWRAQGQRRELKRQAETTNFCEVEPVSFRWLDELARDPGNGTKVTEPVSEMGPSRHQFPNRRALNVSSMRCASPGRVNADRRWLPCWTAQPLLQQATYGEPGRQDFAGRPKEISVAASRRALLQETRGPFACCQLGTWCSRAGKRSVGSRPEGESVERRASHAALFWRASPARGNQLLRPPAQVPPNPFLADPTSAPGGDLLNSFGSP